MSVCILHNDVPEFFPLACQCLLVFFVEVLLELCLVERSLHACAANIPPLLVVQRRMVSFVVHWTHKVLAGQLSVVRSA